MLIKIENLNIFYKNLEIVKDFNLILNEGDTFILKGPTGYGKSTVLNFLAEILDDNFHCEGNLESVKKDKIKISYMLQDAVLLPQLSVLKNVMLPIEKLYGKKEAESKAKNILAALDLQEKINFLPSKLSGGEKQRVSFARAFIFPCELLLLDEPFSAQDDFHKNLIQSLIQQKQTSENCGVIITQH